MGPGVEHLPFLPLHGLQKRFQHEPEIQSKSLKITNSGDILSDMDKNLPKYIIQFKFMLLTFNVNSLAPGNAWQVIELGQY